MYHLPAHHLNGYHGLGNPAVPMVQATPPSPPTGGPVLEITVNNALRLGGRWASKIIDTYPGLPYLAGAGVLGALAFLVLRPKAAPSATPNRRKRMTEAQKRTVFCPVCGAWPGKACRSSSIPLGGGWGGPGDLKRAHERRRPAYLAGVRQSKLTTR